MRSRFARCNYEVEWPFDWPYLVATLSTRSAALSHLMKNDRCQLNTPSRGQGPLLVADLERCYVSMASSRRTGGMGAFALGASPIGRSGRQAKRGASGSESSLRVSMRQTLTREPAGDLEPRRPAAFRAGDERGGCRICRTQGRGERGLLRVAGRDQQLSGQQPSLSAEVRAPLPVHRVRAMSVRSS